VIPLGQLGLEFVLGIGAALFGANAWAFVRPRVVRSKDGRPLPRPPSTRRVVVNMVIGAAAMAWALASLIAR
jgi:hypothetical protein